MFLSRSRMCITLLLICLCGFSLQDNVFEITLNKVTKDSVGGRLQYVEPDSGVVWTIILKTSHYVDRKRSNEDVVFHIHPECEFKGSQDNCKIKDINLVDSCDNHIYDNASKMFNTKLPMLIYSIKPNTEEVKKPFAVSFNCYITLRIRRVLVHPTSMLKRLTFDDMKKFGSHRVGNFFPDDDSKDVPLDAMINLMKSDLNKPN